MTRISATLKYQRQPERASSLEVLVVFAFGQTSDLLRGDACSNALGFLFAQESRDEQAGHQACDPGGHDAHPQLTAGDFIA